MIEPVIERTIVVRDSDDGDETMFVIRTLGPDEDNAGRQVVMPGDVWLNLDDTDALGRELVALAQVLRDEREPVVVGVKCNACRLNDTVIDAVCTRCDAPDDVEPVAKKTAPRKRAAKKVAT